MFVLGAEMWGQRFVGSQKAEAQWGWKGFTRGAERYMSRSDFSRRTFKKKFQQNRLIFTIFISAWENVTSLLGLAESRKACSLFSDETVWNSVKKKGFVGSKSYFRLLYGKIWFLVVILRAERSKSVEKCRSYWQYQSPTLSGKVRRISLAGDFLCARRASTCLMWVRKGVSGSWFKKYIV